MQFDASWDVFSSDQQRSIDGIRGIMGRRCSCFKMSSWAALNGISHV